MFFDSSPANFFRRFLKQSSSQFFTSIAIRALAIGMVVIFEPVYLYLYFGKSLSLTILYFGVIHGIYGLFAVFGGKLMTRIGARKSMLFSHFFFFGYFIALSLIQKSFLLVPLAMLLKGIGMTLFWPAFHVDFSRLSGGQYQGREVGKMNVALILPTIISPVLGGVILSAGGYPALFSAVLVVLFASSIPMFLSKESHIVYSDSYRKAWARIFKKENRKFSLAISADACESVVNAYLWPLFMFILAISYAAMGGITTFGLIATALFTLYMGRMSDTIINRVWFLNIGSVLSFMAWLIRYFVKTPFDAFLAATLYQVCRTSAGVPFQTFYYKKVSLAGENSDEFIVYSEVLNNIARFFFMLILAGIFLFTSQLNISFLIAGVLSLGLMFLGLPPKFKW
ncbi:MAG: MFS transporter [bacterium]|nr:MFS transporter [bacterium]